MNTNNQDPNFNAPPKKSPWVDIFLGIGLSLLLIIAMIASLNIGAAGMISMFSIVMLILISGSTFLSVRLIRRNRPIAGKILLATVIPITLILLLFGACFVSMGQL
ncbi:hypothetical protein [Clostridium sp.]|jgi:hypothetical protein|uniref:hypothetical protein n=1 Tax=Clostridium sp. TaxID=1506 RepID=UPI003EEB66B3